MVKRWHSRGNQEGATQIAYKDNSNYDQSWPASEDYVYFIGSNEEIGKEVWRTDGTAEGTVPLADIKKGASSSYPRGLTMVGNTVYFYAQEKDASHPYGLDARSLWRSDGNGVTKVATMPDSFQGEMGERETRCFLQLTMQMLAESCSGSILQRRKRRPRALSHLSSLGNSYQKTIACCPTAKTKI